MRRTVCFLMFIVVTFSLTGFADADNNHILVTQYITSETVLADWAKKLELSEKIDSERADKSVYENLHSDNPPDFFVISTAELPRFLNENLCEPFTPSDKMLDEISAMPPVIQQALKDSIYTQDNKLYAYPLGFEVTSMMFWVPEVWKDSPFSKITPPASYVDLLDFLENYLDTPHEGYCFYYDIFESKYPQLDWISILIKCWVLQCRNSKQPINLNNPEFLSLLKRTIELSNRLYKVEPNIKKQKGRQLFSYHYFGSTTNGQDQYTWENMIPWRITSNQPPLVDVNITLSCARKGGPFSNRTSELFDCFVDHRQDRFDGKVNYLNYLFLNKDLIDINKWNAQVLQKHGSRWKCLFMSQEYVDSIWEIEKYGIPCTADDNYLSNTTWDAFDEYDNLSKMCVTGSISPEDYVEKMDKLAFSNN